MITDTFLPTATGRIGTGFVADGTPSGEIDVSIARGGYAPVPFKPGFYKTVMGNGGSAFSANISTYIQNSDGSNTGVYFKANQGKLNGGYIGLRVPGRVFGVRVFFNSENVGTCAIGCMIDSVTYDSWMPDWTDLGTEMFNFYGSPNFTDAWHIFDANLPDGYHDVKLFITGAPDHLTALDLAGIIVEDRVVPKSPGSGFQVTGSVPTAYAQITDSLTGYQAYSELRSIHLMNTTGAAITVTLKQGTTVFYQQSVPANSSLDYDPHDWISVDQTYNAGIQWIASASGLNFCLNARRI